MADHVVLDSLHSLNHKFTNLSILSSSCATLPHYCLQIDCLHIIRQISFGHGLQVHLQISLITASGCNFLFAGLCPPRVFPNSFSYGLQVRTIMVSEFMSEITLSRPQSAWTHSLHYRLQVHTYMAPKCISNYVQSRLRTASPSSLDHDLLNLLLTKAVSLS